MQLDDIDTKIEEGVDPEVVGDPPEDPPPEKTAEDEEEYSRRVQKRINTLTGRAKRAETELERERREKSELAERIRKMEEELHSTRTSSIDTELSTARAELKAAIEAGDVDKQLDVQERMAELKAKKLAPKPAVQQETRQQVQQQPLPSAEAQWQQRNPWFSSNDHDDDRATAAALYKKLTNMGYDPDDDELYEELDKRMKALAPELYETQTQSQQLQQQRPAARSPVAGAGRTSTSPSAGKFTADDKAAMELVGLDPNNANDRKSFMANKGV